MTPGHTFFAHEYLDSLEISFLTCTDFRHPVPDAGNQPWNLAVSLLHVSQEVHCSFLCFIFTTVNMELIGLSRRLQLNLICPHNILPRHRGLTICSTYLTTSSVVQSPMVVITWCIRIGACNNNSRKIQTIFIIHLF